MSRSRWRTSLKAAQAHAVLGVWLGNTEMVMSRIYLSRIPDDLGADSVVVKPCHYGAGAVSQSGPGEQSQMSSIHQRLLPEREGLHQQLRHISGGRRG